MYKPYITAKHAERSIIMQYSKLKNLLQENRAEIVFVANDQQTIAGLVIDYSQNTPKFWSLGIEGGQREWDEPRSHCRLLLFFRASILLN